MATAHARGDRDLPEKRGDVRFQKTLRLYLVVCPAESVEALKNEANDASGALTGRSPSATAAAICGMPAVTSRGIEYWDHNMDHTGIIRTGTV